MTALAVEREAIKRRRNDQWLGAKGATPEAGAASCKGNGVFAPQSG